MFIHLLNDFSGSPLVLSEAIESFTEAGYEAEIHTSKSEGFLSNKENCVYKTFNYKWKKNKLFTFINLIRVQIVLFFRILFGTDKDTLIYINTILPFGAALAAYIGGRKIVYHVHETSIKPKAWKALLFGVVNLTANKVIYVSRFLMESETLKKPEAAVIYNALPKSFVEESVKMEQNSTFNEFRVLMLCSLKKYKGVDIFANLANLRPGLQFDLVLNASAKDIERYFKGKKIAPNLNLYDRQSNVHPFYKKASLVMNLSIPGLWNETFGLTALEAMQYGKPVIVPPVGGIAEIVEEGVEGFKVDSRETAQVLSCIDKLSEDRRLYDRFAVNCKEKASKFSTTQMQQQIAEFVLNDAAESSEILQPAY